MNLLIFSACLSDCNDPDSRLELISFFKGTWEYKANGTFYDAETRKHISYSSRIVFVNYGTFIHFVYESWDSKNESSLFSSCGYIRASEIKEEFILVASRSYNAASFKSGEIEGWVRHPRIFFTTQINAQGSDDIKKLSKYKVNNCTLHWIILLYIWYESNLTF